MKYKILLLIIGFLLVMGTVQATTTLQLNDNTTDLINDTMVQHNAPGLNFGWSQTMAIYKEAAAGTSRRAYLMFNISKIPTGGDIQIISASVSLYSAGAGSMKGGSVAVRRIMDLDWDGHNESDMNWTDQVCGAISLDTGDCNLTEEDNQIWSADDTWATWDVTDMVSQEYDAGNWRVSMMFNLTDDFGAGEKGSGNIPSRLYMADTTKRPYLNVTYSIPEDTNITMWFNSTEGNTSIDYGDVVNITAEINTTGLFLELYKDGVLVHNDTGTNITNITDLTWFTAGNIYNITASFPGWGYNQSSSRTFWIEVNETQEAYYNNSAWETDDVTFKLNVTGSEDIGNATLIWNNTIYPYSTVVTSGTSSNFTRLLTIPAVTNDTDVTFYWNYTIEGVEYNTSTQTQRVYNINITNCSDGGTRVYNFTYYDETNLTSLYADMDTTFSFWLGSGSVTENISFEMRNNWTQEMCLYPVWSENMTTLNVDATMDYWNDTLDYEHRSYYYYHANLPVNVTINQSLYLISDGDSDRIVFTIKDAEGYTKEGVHAKIQRYYTGTNTYRTVMIGKSDYLGEFVAYLEPYDVWYKFILEFEGSVLQTINPMQIKSATIDLPISAVGRMEWIKVHEKIAYSCSYNNQTFYLTCIASDTTGYATTFCLNVTELQTAGEVDICGVCDSSSSVTLGCFVGNITDKTFVYTLTARLSFNPLEVIVIVKDWLQGLGTLPIFGLTGVLMTALFVGTSTFAGLWKPSVGVILMVSSLTLCVVFGFINISWASITGIILLGAIVIYMVKK